MDIKAKDTAVPAGLNWRNKTRRRYTPQQRLAMVQECAEPGVSISEVAQRNRVNTNLLFKWCRCDRDRAAGCADLSARHGFRGQAGGGSEGPCASMIGLPAGTLVWLAAGATDMRKSFDGLAALAQTQLHEEAFSGHVFVFRG